MAIRYKALTELYQETQRSVTAPDQWRAFLASACRFAAGRVVCRYHARVLSRERAVLSPAAAGLHGEGYLRAIGRRESRRGERVQALRGSDGDTLPCLRPREGISAGLRGGKNDGGVTATGADHGRGGRV